MNQAGLNPLSLIHDLSLGLEKFLLERRVVDFFSTKLCANRQVEAEKLYWECLKLEEKAVKNIFQSPKSIFIKLEANRLRNLLKDFFWIYGK